MKSKLFESLNDRSNIISAYAKMTNESKDVSVDSQEHLDSVDGECGAPSGMEHPVAVYDEHKEDKWISLDDFEYDNAKGSNTCVRGSDEFYFNTAFELLGTDGVYGKIKESIPSFVPSGVEIERSGTSNSEKDLYDEIVEIGKEAVREIHKDDIEVAIPNWALTYLINADNSALSDEEIKMVDDWEKPYAKDGYILVYDGEDLGFVNSPAFGEADECTKMYLRKFDTLLSDSGKDEDKVEKNESVGETADSDGESKEEDSEGFFDKNGFLVKDIPEEAVIQCSQAMGHDNYDDCKHWVEALGFDNGLDTDMVRRYLKSTGGWDDEELNSFDTKELAIRLLWEVCCTLRENDMDASCIYIKESCGDNAEKNDSIKQKTLKEMKKENPDIEVVNEEDDEYEDDVSDLYEKYMEKGFFDREEDKDDIARVLDAGFTVKDSPNGDVCYVVEWESASTARRFASVDVQPTEESIDNSDAIGDIDGEYDENGIYHEFPKTDNRIKSYRSRFRVNDDGSSKFDELAEELHEALDGCTKGFFSDDQYSVVEEVMKKLNSIGLFTTVTKVENYGNRESDGLRKGKRYHFDATWTNKFGKKMLVHGVITISFAGTLEEPEKKYDACVHFFTDDGNYIRVKC